MLTVADLLTLTTKPLQKDVTIQTILEFYEQHLCTYKIIYELDSEERPELRLRFEPDQLYHLLGIHHVLGKKYNGLPGFNKIKDGTFTWKYMKQKNEQGFKSKKNRMLYFPFVYQLLRSPELVLFDGEKADTNNDSELILYNQVEKAYMHLGVSQYTDQENYYFPRSFYDRNNRDHIDGQTPINIKSLKIEPI
jgi:hypothetical protein